IYGFDIVIESNDIEISGTADGKLKLLGNETDSLFSVNINGKNPGGQITSISNFSSYFQFFNIYVDNIDLFVNTDGKLDFAGNSLTFARDLMKDEEVGFSFYVGDQKLSSNTIAINGSTDGYYVKTIKSPFVVEWVDQFDAPSANQDFITITYDGGDYSQKLSIVELSYISSNLNPSYNIESPIIVEGDYKLSFKAVPLQNEEDATYTATMKLVLQNIESGERITLTHDITVTCQITNFDIEVGKEDVDAGSQPYHYIYAGGTYSVLGGDINISGKLKENINDVKDITVEFEDVDWQVEDSLNIEASKHMTATKYSKDKNDFSLICNDLNYQKTIKIIFNVEFDNGGKVVISKNVVVKPNLHAKLEFDFYEEEEEIILTDSIYMQNSVGGDYNKVEIENFSYENLDANYNKNSFIISNKAFTNISHFSNFEDFNVKVNKGAAALSEQERTIVFTYVTAKYTLVFNIVVDITDIDNISDEDLVIGNYTEDSGGYYYITAGSTLKSSDSTGVQFSDRLRRNIKHLNDKDVEINLTTVSHEGESDVNNMTYKFENGELELSCGALNFKKVIKIVVTFDFKAEGMVAFEKQITILPNLFIKLDKNSFKEGESFDLVQNLLYKEGEESEYQKLDIDFNYRNASDDAKYSIRSFGINENAFVPETETGEELLITVNTDASTLPEENRRITFKYKVDFNGDFYELVYNFVVEITAQ
ncbi:MAG: hypothetical protein IJD48_04140, partial [Clostridia bacterium]|nr:hypothetical protein [Clostridia bacterium]